METRYLTKSRFKLGMECPTKLFYVGKEEYANNNLEDPFLEALSQGGFQVGELAKAYYPGGQSIDTLDDDIALKETNALLKQDNCIIYEAAIKYENLFIRIDILIKEKDSIKIIEVKSKSADKNTDELFLKKNGELKSVWEPYIYDIAFQNYVAEKALPEYVITPYLMLVDKNAVCPIDGLNQKFKISKDRSGRQYSNLSEELSEEDLSEKMLVAINTGDICHKVMYKDTYTYQDESLHFSDLIKRFSDHYKADRIIESRINSSCKKCEFKASEIDIENGLKSGYQQCFKRNLKWEDEDFEEDTIFNLWNLKNKNMKEFIENDKIKLSDIREDDIGVNSADQPGLTGSERQWMQIEKSVNNDTSYYIDKENLRNEMEKWTYPLHFIDFETAMPVIPFNKGRKPYEGIAFQFSHHMVQEDGGIEHRSEYLNTDIGVNPNYDFVRKLKEVLGNDKGTIFRYSTHENSYLNMIYNQLKTDKSCIEDKEALCQFIRDITQSGPKNDRKEGQRNMVDLFELVKSYYYDPYMKGSNSIKQVLPAILNSSDYIKEKYSKPIYGGKDGIKSLNFKDWTWIQFKDGKVMDPYQLLPKLFENITDKDIDFPDELNDGGAAMTAYEKLQFEEIPHEARREIESGLLKYCELDTLAMVIIYEAWVDMLKED